MPKSKAAQKSQNRVPKMGKPKLRIVGGNSPRKPDFPPDERDYFVQLHKLIDRIYQVAADRFEWTWNQLAAHANLGYTTVSNLGERYTKYPRYLTVHKLAIAVGFELAIQENNRNKRTSSAKLRVVAS